MALKMPIGISDFKKLREGNFYYVDKSLFIQEVVERPAEVLLLPRPRRFGKTVNLSMLRYFFEQSSATPSTLFQDLAIAEVPEIMAHQGQYPVISFSFKHVKEPSWARSYRALRNQVARLYEYHAPQLQQQLSGTDQEEYHRFCKEQIHSVDLESGVAQLMRWLHQAYGKPVVVLLDEYEVPLEAGVQYGYADDISVFLRNFFSSVFKDNTDLFKGVLTGCLPLGREAIFSNLNLDSYTVLNQRFSQYFGFTTGDVAQLLDDCEMNDHAENIQQWYGGYRFGNHIVSNPWSVLNFLDKPEEGFKAHGVSFLANETLHSMMQSGSAELREPIENLLQNGSVSFPVSGQLCLQGNAQKENMFWNFLAFSGYATWNAPEATQKSNELQPHYELNIPNLETQSFYEEILQEWPNTTAPTNQESS